MDPPRSPRCKAALEIVDADISTLNSAGRSPEWIAAAGTVQWLNAAAARYWQIAATGASFEERHVVFCKLLDAYRRRIRHERGKCDCKKRSRNAKQRDDDTADGEGHTAPQAGGSTNAQEGGQVDNQMDIKADVELVVRIKGGEA